MLGFQNKVLHFVLVLSLSLVLTANASGAPNDRDNGRSSDEEQKWSEIVNGLQARLSLERWKVTNGSCIVATHLELKNVSSTLLLTKTPDNMKFRVIDKDGKEIEVDEIVSFSGWLGGTPQLVLPHASSMRVRIGPTGHGIGSDRAAHLDLGIHYCWALPEGEYYLSAVLEIDRKTKKAGDAGNHWHGRIELPRVLIPTKPTLIPPEKVGPLIDELGSKMVSNKGYESEEATNRLSLIDDPRVVPWYVKALKLKNYGCKCTALDRLSYFESEEAFEALKFGMATTPQDITNATKPKVTESLVNNVRIYAANGLARSPHPEAEAFLLKFHDDASPSIRLKAIQFAARRGTAESLSLIRSHLDDKDEMVRQEAKVLLDSFESK